MEEFGTCKSVKTFVHFEKLLYQNKHMVKSFGIDPNGYGGIQIQLLQIDQFGTEITFRKTLKQFYSKSYKRRNNEEHTAIATILI